MKPSLDKCKVPSGRLKHGDTKLNKATRRRFIVPLDRHENNPMASLREGDFQQSHIDAIAEQAGAMVEVRQGDILLNKDESEQNFVITCSEDVFVPAIGNNTSDVLFFACIDHYRGPPSYNKDFSWDHLFRIEKELRAHNIFFRRLIA